MAALISRVASVQEEENLNEAFVRLETTDAVKQNATVTITVETGPDVKHKKVTIKHRDDLYVKSGDRAEYRNGFIVSEISFEPGNEYVQFGGGLRVTLEHSLGSLSDDIMRVQIVETVKEHCDKERKLRPRGIKVLSLFFIDRVANYRVYNDDGSWTLGKIGQWFEDAFREVSNQPENAALSSDAIEKVHDGYFSQDRKGQYRDTSGETAADQGAYELIMKDKERLLSLDEPLRFIFSHSALREGWDNPNIFQICTLNETRSTARKRQEIGRGLRLPVNQLGERIHDETVNRLTVVANESYKGFAEALQTEYEQDCNVRFGVIPKEAFSKIRMDREGQEWQVDQTKSAEIWPHLRDAGYIGAGGRIEAKFDPKNPLLFGTELPNEFQPIRNDIFDAISQYTFRDRIVRQRAKQQISYNKQIALDQDFQLLWDRISKKTRYRVKFTTDELVENAVLRIKGSPRIDPLRISTDYRAVAVTQAGVAAGSTRKCRSLLTITASVLIPVFISARRALEGHDARPFLSDTGSDQVAQHLHRGFSPCKLPSPSHRR
jgi:type III restriction enzyme